MKFFKSAILLSLIFAFSIAVAQEHVRNAKWGMNKQEVKSSETTKLLREQSNTLMYQDNFDGIPMYIQYVFPPSKDKLAQVRYYSAEEYTDQTKYIDDYKKVKTQLTDQYGKPARDTLMWKNDQLQGQKDKYGQAIANGDLSYLTQWVTSATNIRSQLWGDDKGKVQMAIQYTSKKYQSFLR